MALAHLLKTTREWESDHFEENGIEQLYFEEQIYEELTLFLTQGSFSCHIHPISS